MKLQCVYLHKNTHGEVFYVGCCASNQNKSGVRAKLQRAYATCGHSAAWHAASANGYSVEILEIYSDKAAAFAREVEVIALHRSIGSPLVNIAAGGPGMPGVKDTFASRQKKSATKIGALNPMYGKTGIAHPLSRPVVNIQNGVFYESIVEASAALGQKMQTLHKRLTGKLPNNTLWRFA